MQKRKILLLTFYFPPDLGAGSFRSHALVESLMARLPEGYSLEVITTAPNRYAQFATHAPSTEEAYEGRLKVHRIRLPSHRSGIWDQSKAFAAYACGVVGLTRGQNYGLVIATSSRLMTAVLGRYVVGRSSARFYLDIRDIFVENLPFLLPVGARWLGNRFFSILEQWAVKRAAIVNLVSPGFEGYFKPRYPTQTFTWHSNGVDTLFVNEVGEYGQQGAVERETSAPLRVLYAGNIGLCQGLDEIIPELAKKLEGQVVFTIIGDGGRRVELEKILAEHKISNVEIRDPVERDKLLQEYQKADVLFLHLNDMPCFSRVIPSKLFEYAATGKPILAGVRAYPAEFCKQYISNSSVFDPCNVRAAISAISALRLSTIPREEFVKQFSRQHIMGKMSDDIVNLVKN
ncbi:glycosyltransferase family 4 protein [Halomonas sp. HAL1]|uniref:glycosyltransferase family 4 protein n=1 Tax=Halomonas sp. HAL1 TaxID=550984 RepID=UPI00022D3309|nr:glycosyltransferase family 4 protein [Halomonas sp. HAL1]EHA13924.1 putative group 1 glycosyl transferase [Halomonas sp. HAL1]WKV94271.1 glycosyltransferase family 4 protein [Halomonas sp. HAL1]